jgi:hypothetical protein
MGITEVGFHVVTCANVFAAQNREGFSAKGIKFRFSSTNKEVRELINR